MWLQQYAAAFVSRSALVIPKLCNYPKRITTAHSNHYIQCNHSSKTSSECNKTQITNFAKHVLPSCAKCKNVHSITPSHNSNQDGIVWDWQLANLLFVLNEILTRFKSTHDPETSAMEQKVWIHAYCGCWYSVAQGFAWEGICLRFDTVCLNMFTD